MNDKKESEKFTFSHLGIIRLFAIWGLLDALIYYITNGDRYKELVIHMVVFLLIYIIAWKYPVLIKYL
uniref:Uncharacterized protein n=1 Tax=viral metagenome TaxID=1070528 RepID=A0A6C0H293_9ZZZZ